MIIKNLWKTTTLLLTFWFPQVKWNCLRTPFQSFVGKKMGVRYAGEYIENVEFAVKEKAYTLQEKKELVLRVYFPNQLNERSHQLVPIRKRISQGILA